LSSDNLYVKLTPLLDGVLDFGCAHKLCHAHVQRSAHVLGPCPNICLTFFFFYVYC